MLKSSSDFIRQHQATLTSDLGPLANASHTQFYTQLRLRAWDCLYGSSCVSGLESGNYKLLVFYMQNVLLHHLHRNAMVTDAISSKD